MKKTVLFAIGLLALASCDKLALLPYLPRPATLRASVEGETKTSYTEDEVSGKAIFGWQAGDKINVLYSNGSGGGYHQCTFSTSAGDGTFTGTVTGTEGGRYAYLAVYPYDILTTVIKNSSNQRENISVTLPASITGSGAASIPMVAHAPLASFSGTYEFKHLGSVLRFKITGIPAAARKLRITSAQHKLCGQFNVSYNGEYYIQGGSDGEQKTLTFSFVPGADGVYTFYLPFGVGVKPTGDFTFTLLSESDGELRTRTTTLGGLADVTPVRGGMYRGKLDF